MPARTTALRALIACRTADAWSDAVLRDYMAQAKLSQKDAALCTTLCYGVQQNRALLDYHIDHFLTGRKRLPPALRDILRLAVYQILFLDRIPDSAAVNEAVKQAKRQFGPREGNLANAVLRSLLRQKDTLETPRDYAIRYSHPPALVDLMKQSVGGDLEKVLMADNSRPETCVQVNPLKTTAPELEHIWAEEGVTFSPHSWMPGCYQLKNTGDLEQLPSFRQGLFQVQDPAARLSVAVLELKPGMRVLDLCAAPGGKSMAAAMYMENRGEIIACDLHRGKLPQIEKAAERLGVSIVRTMENDGTVLREAFLGAFDAVISDVPCSGLGVIRKKPDIRYKDISSMEALPAIQQRILQNAAAYVQPGGQLLYSTCTILTRENEAVVESFLQHNADFRMEPVSLGPPGMEGSGGMLRLLQGIHDCDGFFLCRMRKAP